MDKTIPTSLIGACQDFFGRLPGQTLGQFSEDFKKLTEKDKEEIRNGLIKLGYNVSPLQNVVTK